MADENEENTENNGKGGKTKLIIIIAAVLLLLVGGGVAFFLLSGGDDASTAEDAVVSNQNLGASAAGPAQYLSLEPAFIVDFNIKGKQRYLQLDLTVKSRSKEQIYAVRTHMPLIRNSLVLLFSSQDFAELQTASGKQQLKQDAVDAINAILRQETGVEGVEKILFTNFVMQ
ncbi:flagellar protein [Marinomonas agarivorans]|nr:flagellar protein [Marinomonas agarivorans]